MHQFELEKELPYNIELLYQIITEVEKYPEFLPWCGGSRIVARHDDHFVADLIIRFKLYTEKYRSRVWISPPKGRSKRRATIETEVMEGPFECLENFWTLQETKAGTRVHFFVRFEFKSQILDKIIGLMFDSVSRKMIESFERRAAEIARGNA